MDMQIVQEQFLLGPSARNSDFFRRNENMDFIYDFIQLIFSFYKLMLCPHVPFQIATLITRILTNSA